MFVTRFQICLPVQFTCRNLESNGLTGRLPPELGKLNNLEELLLDRNRLQGTVPAGSNADFPSSMHGM